MTHLKATAIQVTMVGKPVKIFAASLSPSRSLIGAELSACFGEGMPGLMADELNAKHVEWNSRLSKDGENSCAIMPIGTPVSSLHRIPEQQYPLNYLATPDVLDILITKNLTSLVYLSS
jgi:hypothetical protein